MNGAMRAEKNGHKILVAAVQMHTAIIVAFALVAFTRSQNEIIAAEKCVEACFSGSDTSGYLMSYGGGVCECIPGLRDLEATQREGIRRTQPKRLALFVHLGQSFDRRLWEHYSKVVKVSGYSFDVYCNTRSIKLAKSALRIFGHETKLTLQEENSGMDVGGFLISLLASYRMCAKYDFVIKLHSKREGKWLQDLAHPILGTVSALHSIARAFDDAEVGQVFAQSGRPDFASHFPQRRFLSFELGDRAYFGVTAAIEDGIIDVLGLNIRRSHRVFMAGTMFALRWSVITKALDPDSVAALLDALNSPVSYDANWFSVMSRDLLRSQNSEVLFDLPGNSLSGHHQPGYLPDGQAEHAWERVLCYFAPALGYKTKLQYNERNAWMHIDLFEHIQAIVRSDKLRSSRNQYCDDVDDGYCLKEAVTGECLLTPTYTFHRCSNACKCVHGKSGYPSSTQMWHDLDYFLKIVHPHRKAGPFRFVAYSYESVIECVEEGLELAVEISPVRIHPQWELSRCSRILSRTSGNQLFLGADAVLRLNDRHYMQTWTTPMAAIGPRERRTADLRVSQPDWLGHATLQLVSKTKIAWETKPFKLDKTTLLFVDDNELCFRVVTQGMTNLQVCAGDPSISKHAMITAYPR